MNKWLSIVGIGEDGLEGLSVIALSLLNQATIIVGGERHLAMLPPNDNRKKILWKSPFSTSITEIIQRRGQAICVLASGDPMCYGVGAILTKHIPISEITIIPAPSAFSLACSRLGWSLTEVETLSLCGRPASLLPSYIYPGAKLLILSAGKETPGIVAELLTNRGYGGSKITVLERMGGIHERILEGIAASWQETEIADLNTIAVDCITDVGVMPLSRFPGLPDSAFHHDGQLTKREVRAITLSTLAPLPGELLWDVGAGCGSISIEWMRSNSRCRAIALEQNETRINYIADNAAALGTPNLQIITGKAPEIIQNLPTPDAIFVGGGVTAPGLFDICWNALRPGGRMVANVVTLEGEQTLFQWYEKVGGNFTRISIQRAEAIGKFLGWKGMSQVTQWVAVK
ncbi:bifunctional cobalt-precorrin-7 (C(5))-methyltransferase/cobalt-precorrin-6B (C(15))-methyltransferase [Anabaena cylindrica FACHB-243]|uniref:Precorrin-6Y C5,15-methyltransferase (Decarboxylating) n=1 Tax=Anabaena cylindrica (strain ATCC 27899 / PCC 7122) TaxID=272123 RepID=K9ZN03_ANACC|nr:MULTISPECIES: bifunctional cobalt-precorrin-7 (C(5))-methyltransferase/cobalt-precorrin-6B (C(15))-methyltransferase [Anabaena]AFZ60586.1 precorrin-6Y C5,15-methyltransferase (decarboxylating) [Anabaena cylindrica PCC 7122]MBD2418282.1 bifunctional cobalt-precorrin-7 (C(5))-methyltransferase/cobalt-precorrin-6B (C(15))-methyltransferase [Anabaena cylindrica FACHB-243]MBY5281772.1 bifunctional cobalt-precorrin-7 (C(5))-methyltransferase/cobalt-precorrin-6B (C(15))-methyltransferase [Anabaena s